MHNEQAWARVDDYLNERLAGDDPALEGALTASAAAGLPEIAVAPNQGRALMIVCMAIGARTVLEIGTLGGYSAIWLARGVGESGSVLTLEIEARHAEVASGNFRRAGVHGRVEVRVGRAMDSLEAIVREVGEGARARFDLVFIDADKASIAEYFELALGVCRRGAVIVVDNMVREGRVADKTAGDESVEGVRRLLERLRRDERVAATAIQTVGAKGHDGFLLAVVR